MVWMGWGQSATDRAMKPKSTERHAKTSRNLLSPRKRYTRTITCAFPTEKIATL